MKNIITSLIGFVLISLIISSCKKNEDKAIFTPGSYSINSSTSDTLKLKSALAFNKIITYSWDKPNLGLNLATNYIVEFSNSETDWSNSVQIAGADSTYKIIDTIGTFIDPVTNLLVYNESKVDTVVKLRYKYFTHKELNQIAINAGIPELGNGRLYSRIRTRVASSSTYALSSITSNYIYTNSLIPVLNKLYIPGSYQSWTPATAEFLEELIPGSGKFIGLVEKSKADGTKSDSNFKMTPAPNWDYDFGDNGSVYTLPESGSGIIGPKSAGTNNTNFKLADGTYYLTVDTPSLTWTYKLESWGIVGDATPLSWPSGSGTDASNTQDAQNMRYNNVSKMYEITIDLKGGKSILFRKNDAWASKIAGGTGVAKNAPLALNQVVVGSGTGEDIGIATDGNYTIKIDPVTYKIFAVKN